MIDVLGIYVLAIMFIMLIYLFSVCYFRIFCYNSRIHSYDNNNLHFDTNTNENNNNTNENDDTPNHANEEIIIVTVVDIIPYEIILDTEKLPIANPVLRL